jgi:hypothetical protein
VAQALVVVLGRAKAPVVERAQVLERGQVRERLLMDPNPQRAYN